MLRAMCCIAQVLTLEEKRLRAVLRRLVALSLAAVPTSCSTSEATRSSADASPVIDATSQADAPSTIDGANLPAPDSGPAPLADGAVADVGPPDATAPLDSGDDSAPSDAASCDEAYEFLDGADDGSGCDYFLGLSCGLPPEASTEGCFLSLADCLLICGHNVTCRVAECGDAGVIPAGPISIECGTFKIGCGAVGRRPTGLLCAEPASATDSASEWLARAAHLEAASVHAFRRLRDELRSAGAPRRLTRAAERSSRDEVRHARIVSRLARRRGAVPARVTTAEASPARSLVDFAVENAIEGCVRETFGVVVAARQARVARDPRVRAAMRRIAEDETRHAALAWSIARWLSSRLDAGAKSRVAGALCGAIASLRCEVVATPPTLAAELGLPSGREGGALVDAFALALRERRGPTTH
jgi:hypothetical protein